MKSLGLRKRVPFPETYRGYGLIRTHGRVYATPDPLDPSDMLESGSLFTHPAVLSAGTKEELEALIDAAVAQGGKPDLLGICDGHDLLRHRGTLYGVPHSAGAVDLDLVEDRRRAGVVSGRTCEEVEARIRNLAGTLPIEFAGWLPIYEYSGNCGTHPQFTHTADPPPGYRFTCSAPPVRPKRRSFWSRAVRAIHHRISRARYTLRCVIGPFLAIFFTGPRVGIRARLRVLLAVIRLFIGLWRGGGKVIPILRFLQSRHFASQLMLAHTHRPVFLTSMPYTFGQNPWIVEIEDPTTLFYPLIQNGGTCELRIQESPYFPILKTLLESNSCKGILTHMKSTAQMVPTMFASETIRQKVHYVPLGVKVPSRWQRQEQIKDDVIHLLFINSWCQVPANFYVRGGLEVLEAFDILRVRYPQLRLTLRSHLPPLDDHYGRILEQGWVRIIDRFLSAEEMADLHASSHIFLLPAARVHIVSLLQAMSYGLAVVTSDGWGIDEYITHERNGLIVKGRYGKVSWMDLEAGMLREDYEPMCLPDPEVVEGLVEAVSRLVEDRELRQRLGRTGREDVETRYNLEQWNQGLKTALDRALGVESVPGRPSELMSMMTLRTAGRSDRIRLRR